MSNQLYHSVNIMDTDTLTDKQLADAEKAAVILTVEHYSWDAVGSSLDRGAVCIAGIIGAEMLRRPRDNTGHITIRRALGGRLITGLAVTDNQDHLVFDTDAGQVIFHAGSDCCSESWFADITGVDALIGGVVSEVEEIALTSYNVEDGRGRQESDQAYGYKILTDKGRAEIVFRNSSNGYYGGSLEFVRVIEPRDGADRPLKAITDDWKA